MHLIVKILILVIALAEKSLCDDPGPGPGFFLKITKNIPRLGRRSDRSSESFFTKNARTIPRIGRRDGAELAHSMNPNTLTLLGWLNDDDNGMQFINKRMMFNGAAAAEAIERELSVVQPVNSNTLIELLNQDAIPNENVKFVHWKDFDRALQSDMELYSKMVSLGRKPDQRLKEDLGLSTYVPVSFFNVANKNGYHGGFYNNAGNEMYAGKYDRQMLEYNELK